MTLNICGTTRTYVGKVCRKCKSRVRYESTSGCVKCTQTIARDAYRRFPAATRARKRKWYAGKGKDRHKNNVLIANYGITLEQFNTMLKKQSNVCYICHKTCVSGRQLCVDHDHKRKRVRGLLCVNCNRGIGNFRDNITLLAKAIKYLRKHERNGTKT